MTSGGAAGAMASAPAQAVWGKACQVLKRELGDATFGSWLGQAALRESGNEVCVVAATGVARDWIRNNAWRRIGELWAQNDPMGRHLDLKSRMEVDLGAPQRGPSAAGPAPAPNVFEIETEAVAPAAARQPGRAPTKSPPQLRLQPAARLPQPAARRGHRRRGVDESLGRGRWPAQPNQRVARQRLPLARRIRAARGAGLALSPRQTGRPGFCQLGGVSCAL